MIWGSRHIHTQSENHWVSVSSLVSSIKIHGIPTPKWKEREREGILRPNEGNKNFLFTIDGTFSCARPGSYMSWNYCADINLQLCFSRSKIHVEEFKNENLLNLLCFLSDFQLFFFSLSTTSSWFLLVSENVVKGKLFRSSWIIACFCWIDDDLTFAFALISYLLNALSPFPSSKS